MSRTPKIEFGAGTIDRLPDLIKPFGVRCLLLTGGNSLKKSGQLDRIVNVLNKQHIIPRTVSVSGEPSPELIDTITGEYRSANIDVVVAIGGGSVLDAGKAVAAMIPHEHSVVDHLEGLPGYVPHNGLTLPVIAIPTTAGTGSEATKNAVLSRPVVLGANPAGPGANPGEKGFKRSLRHENFIPQVAIIDPLLMLDCPPKISAACGMDAFTQLLEGYVSTGTSALTDMYAFEGMKRIRGNLLSSCSSAARDPVVRGAVAYGALLSGIVLANAGLGVIHGLASVAGGFHSIPHGIFCGTILASATKRNIEVLREKDPNGLPLKKYAAVGRMLSKWQEDATIEAGCSRLISELERWTTELKLPCLGEYGITDSDLERIAAASSCKTNPAELTQADMNVILRSRL